MLLGRLERCDCGCEDRGRDHGRDDQERKDEAEVAR
jgi:hypothetical protein